jgi:hypothetical protein
LRKSSADSRNSLWTIATTISPAPQQAPRLSASQQIVMMNAE